MSRSLEGKIAFVTAGTQGIGLAAAVKLAELGCHVAVCGRTERNLLTAEAAIKQTGAQALALKADLTKPQDTDALISRVIEKFGSIDILVINSGHIPYGGLEDFDDHQWYSAFELLLMSAVRLTRKAIPAMRLRGGGDIIFVTSATVKEPSQTLLLSSVMRLGVSGLAKTLATSCAPHNIRVNVVAPGYFDSGRIKRRLDDMMVKDGVTREEAAGAIAGEVPMGRIGDPSELGELIAFIASRKAGFMTGSSIFVDGGRSRSLF